MSDGNIVALRAALEGLLDECCTLCDVPNQMSESGHVCSWRNRWSGCQSKAIDKAIAALAAPVRNCDRFQTASEVSAYWNSNVCTVPLPHDAYGMRIDGETYPTFLDWLMAPAKEGK